MKQYAIKIQLLLALCFLILTGCATTQNELTTGKYIKKTIPHNTTSFRQVWAVEEGGKLRVSGKLRLKGISRVNVPGNVEVALLDQNGNVLASQKVIYYPKVLRNKRGRRAARFTAIFNEAPSPGSTIRLGLVN